ncbi:MAG: ETC complex I subunit [Geminicoccaceae bacterium]
MPARIYQPAKTAVSSGKAKTKVWVLEMEPKSPKRPDRLIGWVGSDDTEQQILLRFPSKEAALAYARKHGIEARVHEPHTRAFKPKSYAENFIRRV